MKVKTINKELKPFVNNLPVPRGTRKQFSADDLYSLIDSLCNVGQAYSKEQAKITEEQNSKVKDILQESVESANGYYKAKCNNYLAGIELSSDKEGKLSLERTYWRDDLDGNTFAKSSETIIQSVLQMVNDKQAYERRVSEENLKKVKPQALDNETKKSIESEA